MLQACVAILVLLNVSTFVLATYELDVNSLNAITSKILVRWRNATVPFFVEPLHFDHEQTIDILSALSMFAFKTCLKFKPVMARPTNDEEVLVFINPDGIRRCNLETKGHSVFTPHYMTLGYECLKPPHIDMMIMRALGFPFEHNRITRDMYIEVLQENIEPGAIEFFTKEDTLPLELRFLPYDINSVMHFGNRDYSKNGHRTILFKDANAQQNRVGLSQTDLKKIEIVYGPECRARDRQEKIDLCQSFPGVARKKREAEDNDFNLEHSKPYVQRRKRDVETDSIVTKSLRVNPNITPPPANTTTDVTVLLKELGVDQEVQEIVEQIYKVSTLALKNAREKYCHNNVTPVAPKEVLKATRKDSDILGIIEVVAAYANDMVDDALKNLTRFCEESESMSVYQRQRRCDWSSGDSRCRETYRSTKSGPVKHSTQHRPIYQQSTKHYGEESKQRQYGRARNDSEEMKEATDNNNTPSVRRKREDTSAATPVAEKEETKKEEVSEITESPVKDVKEENKHQEVLVDKTGGSKENRDKKEAATEKKENSGEKTPEKKEEVKGENVEGIDDKKVLRLGTHLPGLARNRPTVEDDYRRSKKRHRSKRTEVNPIDQEYDSMDAETERPKKKHKGKYKAVKKHRVEEIADGVEIQIPELHLEQLFTEIPEVTDVTEITTEPTIHLKPPKKRGHKQRSIVKHKEDVAMEDDVVEKSLESAINEEEEAVLIERPKAKKRSKHRQKEKEQIVVALDEPDRERRIKHKLGKEKKRKGPSALPTIVTLSKKNEEFYRERRWPQGQLNYMIQDNNNFDLSVIRNSLAEVNAILKRKTCVKMVEVLPGQENKFDDYIVIDNSPDYVTGRVGGRQTFGAIELFQGGQHRQHAAMMVMAMLGFYFEVARHDRDKHIRVHMRHVRPDKLHHFEMIRSDATLPLPYDYASATHPAWQFWRQIGRSGISTVATFKEKDPDGTVMKSLGQNSKLLSDTDIVKINSVYGIDCFQNPRAKIDVNPKMNNNSAFTVA